MIFKAGDKVNYKGKVYVVEHTVIRRIDLFLKLVDVQSPVDSRQVTFVSRGKQDGNKGQGDH
jgi:hypothetical protein